MAVINILLNTHFEYAPITHTGSNHELLCLKRKLKKEYTALLGSEEWPSYYLCCLPPLEVRKFVIAVGVINGEIPICQLVPSGVGLEYGGYELP